MKTVPSVTIGTPHNRDLTPEFVISLISMLRGSPLNIKVALYQSCLVHVGRNVIAQGAQSTDYLLFVDSDIEFPSWGLGKLLDSGKDVIGGMYFKKGPPHSPLVYKYDPETMSHECIQNPPSETFECDGLGTGFLLIKKEVLVKLFDKDFVKENGFPFAFMTKPDGNDIGEDLAFCIRARKAGFSVWCDPSIPLKHVGDKHYTAKDYYSEMKELAKQEAWPYDNQIESWMTKEEMNWLFKVAQDKQSIVEIGSWMGKSTHALLSACKGTVTAVDHFKGSPGEEAHVGKDPYPEFIKNVGMFANLKVLKMSSQEAAREVETTEMVFIDGAHDYDSVKADIKTWLPKTTKLICGHDIQWPGVQVAVAEELGFVHTCGTIWYKLLT